MLDKLISYKWFGAAGAVGFAVGVGFTWWIADASAAKAAEKRAEQQLTAEREAHEETKGLMGIKDELVKVLQYEANGHREYIQGLQAANVELATRLPRDTVRYIERGQELADEEYLKGGSECLRYVVPDVLRKYANGQDIDTGLSLPANF